MQLSANDIQNYYMQAINYFSTSHPEWICTVEQGVLVIQLNWQNATYFNGMGLTHASRVYRHIVKIFPDGKWMATDVTVNNDSCVGLGGIRISESAFSGKQWSYQAEKVLGHDNQTGQNGILTYKFNTADIQVPVKEYFNSLGFKYKFFSLKESFRGLPKGLRIGVGVVFVFVGILLLAIFGAIVGNPDATFTTTVNGVTTVSTGADVPGAVKIIMFGIPGILLVIGVFMLIATLVEKSN